MKEKNVVASIQALRAIAVSLVVLNHFSPRAVPGGFIGVDVFFVVSGFLISSHLLKELALGDLDFGRFYLRRARRLLPASLLVLAVTAVGAYVLMPAAWQASNLRDVAAAAVYAVNWWLAANAVNYFADTGVASPVNHFWSLSVEEQFYLVWPGLMYGALLAGLALTRRSFACLIPSVISILLASVLALSLLCATHELSSNRAIAYFVTHARAWEFAAGGLSALALRQFPGLSSPLWSKALATVAWLTLSASGWLLTPQSDVPGLAAAPVVLATAIILFVGDNHGSRLGRRIIAFRPVQWLGDISYSLYLWHWPVLILAPFALGVAKIGVFELIGLLAVSLAISAASKRHVEDRFRFPSIHRPAARRRWSGTVAIAGYLSLSAVVAGCALLGAGSVERKSAAIGRILHDLSLDPAACFGGRAVEAGANCPRSHMLSNRDFALQNWTTQIVSLPNGSFCQNAPGDPTLAPCAFGAPENAAIRHIALFGDSHAGMWEAAIAQFAESAGLRIQSFVASSCVVSADDRSVATYLAADYRLACRRWRKAAAAKIIADPRIEMVVITDNAYHQKFLSEAGGWSEDDGTGLVTLLRAFRDAGKRVVLIDDVPDLPSKLPDCLARSHSSVDPCAFDQASLPSITPIGRAATLMPPGEVEYVTFKDVFCDGATCHTVIGGIPA